MATEHLDDLVPQVMYVSEEDYRFLCELLNKPPEPNEALVELFKGQGCVE